MEDFSLREETDLSNLTWIEGIPHFKGLPVLISLITQINPGYQQLQSVSDFYSYKIKPEYQYLFEGINFPY